MITVVQAQEIIRLSKLMDSKQGLLEALKNRNPDDNLYRWLSDVAYDFTDELHLQLEQAIISTMQPALATEIDAIKQQLKVLGVEQEEVHELVPRN